MADNHNDDDVLLMQRLGQGDDLALNELMRRWKEPLIHFMMRYVSDREEALDLAQETFVRVYEARNRFKPGSKFSTWLFTIGANLSKNHLRWASRHPKISLDASPKEDGETSSAPLAEKIASLEPGPGDGLIEQERAHAVQTAIRRLPHEQKTALILAEYDDMPVSEIAGILDCSPKAAENHLYRARLSLRKSLERFLNDS